jgi:acetylornithine/succinyldiaminopimelate/putrescine aminotransferase
MVEQQQLYVFKMQEAKLWFYRRFYKIADDLDALAAFKIVFNIAGFLVEPIQGEAVFMFLAKDTWQSQSIMRNTTYCSCADETGIARRKVASCGNCSCWFVKQTPR